MKNRLLSINIYFVVFMILSFSVHMLMIKPSEINFIDFLRFFVVFLIAVISFLTNRIVGLILSMIAIFGFSSYILYESLFNVEASFSSIYSWLIVYPATGFIAGSLGEYIQKLIFDVEDLTDKVENLVTIDKITGFGNIKQFYGELEQAIAMTKRYDQDLTLMIASIDYYDQLLAMEGRKKTEKIIRVMAVAMGKSTRLEDEWYRIDEDKFGIILPSTNEKGAEVVKQRLKEELKLVKIADEELKFSIKISLQVYSEEIQSADDFKKKAERKLEYDV